MRPALLVEIDGSSFDVLIDTGFNGNLAIGLDAAARLRVTQARQIYYASTAGGEAPFRLGTCVLRWFDRRIPVTVKVWQVPKIGIHDGLLGTELLVGYILVVDFNEGDVEIRDPARQVSAGGP